MPSYLAPLSHKVGLLNVDYCKHCRTKLFAADSWKTRGLCIECFVQSKVEKRLRRKDAAQRRQHNNIHDGRGVIQILKQRLTSAASRAFKSSRKIPASSLSMSFLLELYDRQKGKCALTGNNLSLGTLSLNSRDTNVISLDRIDSTKGYSPDNVQLVTHQVNTAKAGFSQESFIKMCYAVVKEEERKKTQAVQPVEPELNDLES